MRTGPVPLAAHGVPLPLDSTAARPGRGAQPHRLLGAPHQLRPKRAADRSARGLLRRTRCRRNRADHHRGTLHPPHRLALREADPRLPPRRHPRLPKDHRRRTSSPRADLRPDQPQRRPGLVDVLAAAGVGTVAGRRPALPRGPQSRHPRRDRRDRRRLRTGGRTLRRRRLRRHRTAVLTQLDRARFPLPRHQPPHRRLRRLARESGPPPRRHRHRRPQGDRARHGARRADLRRRTDRTRHHDRRCRSNLRDRRGNRPGRLHQHLDRRGDGEPVHDRGVDAHPARLRDVHPVSDPQGSRPAGGWRRAIQGSTPGRASAGRGSLRSRRRGPRADRRRRLRGEGSSRRHRRDTAVPVVQPGVRGPDGSQPLARLHRESRAPGAKPRVSARCSSRRSPSR